MGLKQVLHKLKLVELDAPAASKRAAAPAERPLDAILAEIEPAPPVDERKLPATSFPSFAEVYAAAGISEPAHGFSAHKVLEILQAAEFATLDPKAKAAAILGFLKMNPTGPVSIADVVQDAVRRDQALDRFEEFLRAKLTERASRLEADNGALQGEIDELTARNRSRMEANRQALDEERRRLDTWLAGKRDEEQRLASAVEPFVERSPIST